MKKQLLTIAALILSAWGMQAQAQIYDLVRSVNTLGSFLQDTRANDYTQTGTLEISGKTIRRVSTICQSGNCINLDLTDEVIAIDPVTAYRALIAGDSGDLATVTILSTHPTIILMEENSEGKVSIEEYKPR